MSASSVDGSELFLVCSFCGAQHTSMKRCSGCGAAHYRDSQPGIQKQSKPKRNNRTRPTRFLVQFVLAVVAGLCVSYSTVFLQPSEHSSVVADTPVLQGRPIGLSAIKLSGDGLKHRLSAISSDYEFYYAGIREPKSPRRPVTINLNKTNANIVLVLSSHKEAHWQVSNPHKVNVIAIIYGSDTGTSTIGGELSGAQTLLSDKSIGAFYQLEKCECVSASFQCVGDDFKSGLQAIESLGSGRLTSVSHSPVATSLLVPDLDAGYLLQYQEQQRRSAEKVKARCFATDSVRSPFFVPSK